MTNSDDAMVLCEDCGHVTTQKEVMLRKYRTGCCANCGGSLVHLEPIGSELLVELQEGETVKDMGPHCDRPGCCFLAVLTNRRHFHINIFTKEIFDETPIN